MGGSKLCGSWSGTGHCGAVTIASCVIPVGGCCSTKVFSELRGALIGVVVEVVGWTGLLTARTESIDSEVIGVETAEVERGTTQSRC